MRSALFRFTVQLLTLATKSPDFFGEIDFLPADINISLGLFLQLYSPFIIICTVENTF